jgi:hypothetical protein
MAITLSGDGSISGLTSGAGIAATALSGQVPDANAPSGSILQIVNARDSNQFTMSTSTWTDFPNLTISITPISTSSKILLVANAQANYPSAGRGASLRFTRNGTAINTPSFGHETYFGGVVGIDAYVRTPMVYLDSPNTTSSITYKVQATTYNSGTVIFNYSSGFSSDITAYEVAP